MQVLKMKLLTSTADVCVCVGPQMFPKAVDCQSFQFCRQKLFCPIQIPKWAKSCTTHNLILRYSILYQYSIIKYYMIWPVEDNIRQYATKLETLYSQPMQYLFSWLLSPTQKLKSLNPDAVLLYQSNHFSSKQLLCSNVINFALKHICKMPLYVLRSFTY